MTKFVQNGDSYMVASDEQLVVSDTLPVGVYVLNFNNVTNQFFLKKTLPFNNPCKIYGDVYKHTDRIITTYQKRGKNTGVLLSGEKGSGKTLLAREVSIKIGKDYGVPVVIIDQSFNGDLFNGFMRAIDQPCVVFIDEFEKVYGSTRDSDNEDNQSTILTLMDGTVSSNKLFLLTVNEVWEVSRYLKNRPNRIFYHIEFDCLPIESIREYVKDRLDNQSRVEEVVRYLASYYNINFDMVTAFVEETNRYGEDLVETATILNMNHAAKSLTYNATLFIDGVDVTRFISDKVLNLSISTQRSFNTWVYSNNEKFPKKLVGTSAPFNSDCRFDEVDVEATFKPSPLKHDDNTFVEFSWDDFDREASDTAAGKYVFSSNNMQYTLTEQPAKRSYSDYNGVL